MFTASDSATLKRRYPPKTRTRGMTCQKPLNSHDEKSDAYCAARGSAPKLIVGLLKTAVTGPVARWSCHWKLPR